MSTTTAPLLMPERHGALAGGGASRASLGRALHRRGPSAVSRWAVALRATAVPTLARPLTAPLVAPRIFRRPAILRNVVGGEVLAVSTMVLMLVAAALI